MKMLLGVLCVCLFFSMGVASAIEISTEDWEAMRKEMAELRKEVKTNAPTPIKSVDNALTGKFGPDAPVSTKQGKLKISGLVQIWFQSIENDKRAVFDDPDAGFLDSNEGLDNDGFSVRRTDLRFDIDIHENIAAVIWIDPAREALSNIPANSNQGTFKRGRHVNVANMQTGAGAAPRLLQDAYIRYHSAIPHHEFQIGQFRPMLGEEGIRLNGQLDFVERSFIGQLATNRDVGAHVRGTWWNDRFQYWLGVFNGAGNYYLSAGQTQNRVDDNDEKDFQYRLLVRPLWDECGPWGKLELSASSMMGKHGENGSDNPVPATVGLNRKETWAMRHYAHIYYAPGGPVKGWWMRGEAAYIKDRNAPGVVLDPTRADPNAPAVVTTTSFQTIGNTFSSSGFYVSTGYKLSESNFCLPEWMKGLEFAARYDRFENIQVTDPTNAAQTDNFTTEVWTAGINYYIKGHNAKIQFNYNVVDEPSHSRLYEPRNDNFILNFQVWF